jgi:glycine dehydrogenase subunit 1
MFKYFPHTPSDLQTMLSAVGVDSIDALYADVPEQVRFRGDYQLPEEMSELEVRQLFEQLGAQNKQLTCFAGAGVYDHYTPAVIPQLLSRSELLTSYTPYQAEISQGTLHYIFEFQSMMAALTGMDISNASMYDGTTATAEAMMMAVAAGKKQNRFLVSETVDPKTVAVMKTYAHFHGIDIEMVPAKDGVTDLSSLISHLSPFIIIAVTSERHSTASFTSWTLRILAPFISAMVLRTVVPLSAS